MANDLVRQGGEYRLHRYRFILLPRRWNEYEGPNDLDWNCVDFQEENRDAVPREHGIYAFCIRPPIAGDICGAYLLYLGKAEGQTLRDRYGDYVRDIGNENARWKIQRMLALYHGRDCLYFCYTLVEADNVADLEDNLLAAFDPPANDQVPATIRGVQEAFQ